MRRQLYSPFGCIAALMVLFLIWASSALANPQSMRVTLLVPAPDNHPFWLEFTSFSQAVADQLEIDLKVRFNNHNQSRFTYGKLLGREIHADPKPDYVMHIFLRNHSELYLRKAQAAGVKSFIVNSATPLAEQDIGSPRERFPNWIGHSYPDDEKAGHDLAICLINHIRAVKGKDHPIRFLATLGAFDSTAGNFRQRGLKAALRNHGIPLLQALQAGWDGQMVYEKMPKLLERHGYPDVIWNASDHMALAAHKSLDDSGLIPDSPLLIGGVDWTKEGLEAIRDGRIHASLGGHFMEGGWALIKLYDYHNGIDFATDGGASSKLGLSLITTDNIGPYSHLLGDRNWHRIDFRTHSKALNPSLKAYRFSVTDFLADLR